MKQAPERVLKAEQDVHLGCEPYRKGANGTPNSRSGYIKKTLKTSQGPVEIVVPSDRDGSFEPNFLNIGQ